MGKQLEETQVIKSLTKKSIVVSQSGMFHREYGEIPSKTIIIPQHSTNVGIGTLGKLDFMRGQGYAIIDSRKGHQTMDPEEERRAEMRSIISKPSIKSSMSGKELESIEA